MISSELPERARRIIATHFSPTGTTRRVVSRIAEGVTEKLGPGAVFVDRDLASPDARSEGLFCREGDVVVFGVPVYAGRVPRMMVQQIEKTESSGALAIAVVVYGNRDYDDALVELFDLLEARGLFVVAAAALLEAHCSQRRTPEFFRDDPRLQQLDPPTVAQNRDAGRGGRR